MEHQTLAGRPWWWLAAVVAIYLVLAVSTSRTLLPWCDEAWFSTPGFNLAAGHGFGTPLLDETSAWGGRNLTGINRITYWIMPLHPLLVAGWSKVAGASLMAVRTLSNLWGLVALIAWFLTVRKLGGNRAGLFMALLLAVDFQFIWTAAEGRMDMMTEALVACAFCAYLLLRESDFTRAILLANTFMMLAGLTHPIALGGFAGLVFLVVYLDRSRVRLRHLAISAVPYVIGFAAWGAFIAHDPATFRDQFYGNMTGRFSRPGGILETAWELFKERFLWMYGWLPENHGAAHLKILIFFSYVGALIAGWAMPDFRARRELRAWLILCILTYVAYATLDKNVQQFYLLHIITPSIAALALVLDWVLRTRPRLGWAVAAVFVIIVPIQLMTTASRIRQDAYRTRYLDAVQFLQHEARPTDLIMGSSELGWQLGWNANLIDDFRLGYRTGKHPDIIVLDKNRYQDWIPRLKEQEPKTYAYISSLLAGDFREAHRNDAYTIYLPKNR